MSSQSGRYQIYQAINRKTDVSEIERLLKQGKSPDASPPGHPPPLHKAVRFNRPDIALALIKAGCQVKTSRQVERFHSPVICIAASLNMTEVVLNLCMKPECNLFAVDSELKTMVHIAVTRRNCELLKCLPSYFKDCQKFLTARNGLGLTPLHVAASAGDLQILKLLLWMDGCHESNPSLEDFSGNVQLNGLVDTNGEEFSENVTACGKIHEQFPPSVQQKIRTELVNLPVLGSKETMLHLAARGHHVEVVEFLLSCGSNVNAQNMMNNTPLHLLVMHGCANHRALAAARLLLKAGADWALKGTFDHDSAAGKSSGSCVDFERPSLRTQVTVGMAAVLRNRVAFLEMLTEFGAQFSSVDATNRTPLMYALSHGSEEAARFLLVNHPENSTFHTWSDQNGYTHLHLVPYCWTKAAYLTELMLEKGYGAALRSCYVTHPSRFANSVQMTFRNSRAQNFTPLTWAIRHKRLDVLQAMVSHDQSLLLDDFRHATHSPLHVTVKFVPDEDCVPYVNFLLAHGSDGNAVVGGQTAYEYALQGDGKRLRECTVFSATYLKKKLGVFFCKGEYSVGRSGHQELWTLKNMCMERVRQLVRLTKGSYYNDVSSLPLPPSVIRGLLFES